MSVLKEESAFQQRAQLIAGQPSRQHCPATSVQIDYKLLLYTLFWQQLSGKSGPCHKSLMMAISRNKCGLLQDRRGYWEVKAFTEGSLLEMRLHSSLFWAAHNLDTRKSGFIFTKQTCSHLCKFKPSNFHFKLYLWSPDSFKSDLVKGWLFCFPRWDNLQGLWLLLSHRIFLYPLLCS